MPGVDHDQVEEVAHLEVSPDAQTIVHVNLAGIVSFAPMYLDTGRTHRMGIHSK